MRAQATPLQVRDDAGAGDPAAARAPMRARTVPQRNPNQRRHVMPHGRAPITTYMHGTVTKPAVSGGATRRGDPATKLLAIQARAAPLVDTHAHARSGALAVKLNQNALAPLTRQTTRARCARMVARPLRGEHAMLQDHERRRAPRRILKADHQAIVDGGGTDGSAIGLRKLLGKPHATGAQIPQNAGRPGVPHVERSRGLPRHGSLNRKLDLADVAA